MGEGWDGGVNLVPHNILPIAYFPARLYNVTLTQSPRIPYPKETANIAMTTVTAAAASTFSPTRHRFTVADYYAMADAGILTENDRVELLDGDIIDMPPIGDWHAASVNRFNHYFLPLLQGQTIVTIQNPAHLSDISEPQPDVMLVRWRDDFYESGKPSTDDVLLLIEVSDTTIDYDRNRKLSAYARAGIPEVWIVSRQDRRIEAYTGPADGTYSNVRHAGPTETIAPQSFPDVALDVGQFFLEPKTPDSGD